MAAALAIAFAPPAAARAQTPPPPPEPPRVTCSSSAGVRNHCDADTSAGVVLARSTGDAACLLGKTWGYDDTGVWVSDGCTAEFIVGQTTGEQQKAKTPEHVPNVGFLLYEGEKGQIYFRLFSYARYLNQRNLNASYVDYFGNSHTVAQVVGAGNLSYSFNRFVTLGLGITSLPTVRSTEGQFPYWLGVDDRLIADEFFRGSYTTGVWLKGELATKFKYNAMFANNLSTLGVSASQLDNKFDTQSYMLQWLPTTGEFGLYGTFGDYDYHEKVATRVGVHYSHSLEEKQSQPGANGIENSQIRLTDGSIIFTPDLFGQGITVNTVNYQMMSLDAGVKYRGLSLEGEYYRRWLSDFTGSNTTGIADISDNGYQLQSSAMVIPKVLQLYLSGSQIFGRYGDASEVRAGENWYFMKERGLRLNAEWIHANKSPVGYTAYPLPVGGSGHVFHINLEMNF